ncbi:MAG: GGDEF domain-containing protein [Campylobacterales bacterium]|nr:GGDEF domain-containing protein [Campylobacterales bacterium]
MATIDQLSGLHNRMKIESLCNLELERAKRYRETFSVILIDIDRFKSINDIYGHNAGDMVIRALSCILLQSVRSIDEVGRWGGEEFLILFLPNTKIAQAYAIAEKIRINILNNDFGLDQVVTISTGVAQYEDSETIEKIVQQAMKDSIMRKITEETKYICTKITYIHKIHYAIIF